ncbi:TetR/AcrR family transcriptional regulator [Paradesulfitobacterium ferrireducens]|uniref:TetR/AcrR family transcriptional regulator n=1 Tax=Paradesulfitobacterium ferrireducens TaxID=2816476 RepID=UPI001A8DF3CD|nr:TetR/AcrR family transcriptional regulator [Paradesulfitobacterium ferrireducens]
MRAQILQAATAQIIKYGLRGFTLDDITAELSISKKTLYKYFESKSELISEIIGNAVAIEKERATEEMSKYDNWFDKLNALLSVYSYNAVPYRILDELNRYFPQERAQIESIGEYREQIALVLLEEGMAKGEIDPRVNPQVVTLAFKKIFLTPTEQKILDAYDITVNQLMDQMKQLLIYGLLNRNGEKE